MFPHHVHHAANHGVDRIAVAGKGHAQLEFKLLRVEVTRLRRLLGRMGKNLP